MLMLSNVSCRSFNQLIIKTSCDSVRKKYFVLCLCTVNVRHPCLFPVSVHSTLSIHAPDSFFLHNAAEQCAVVQLCIVICKSGIRLYGAIIARASLSTH